MSKRKANEVLFPINRTKDFMNSSKAPSKLKEKEAFSMVFIPL